MILPVIMAGGSGSRLWPLSRGNYPKQFLKLHGENTMLQETILRLNGLEHSPAVIICNEECRFIAAEQIREIGLVHSGIFLEPVARNTAPAIALSAFKAVENNQDMLLLVLAADHVIENKAAFQESVQKAKLLAEQGKLVTFGIVPDSAHTGYGYIQGGQQVAAVEVGFDVASFVEKPEGDGNWINGGFFVCEPKVFDYILDGDSTVFEQAPLQNLAKDGELFSFKHHGFWKCMDSLKDKQDLNEMYDNNEAKWKSWD